MACGPLRARSVLNSRMILFKGGSEVARSVGVTSESAIRAMLDKARWPEASIMGPALLGLLAGALTILSPCVLPVLPFVLFATLERHRFGPLALAGGLVVAFTGI